MKFILNILFVIFTFKSAHAFTLSSSTNSYMQGWDKKNLVFHLNPQNCRSDIRAIIHDGLDLWNSISTANLTLELGSDTAVTAASFLAGAQSDEAIIVCDTTFGTTTGTDPNFVAGVGSNWLNGQNHIYLGALVLNAQAGSSADLTVASELRAKIVVAHEIGHVVGLGHSSDQPALMYYNVATKTHFAISEDDVNGYTYLYPRNEVSGVDQIMGGCGALTTLDRQSNFPSNKKLLILLFLFLMPFVLVVHFKKKRTTLL